MQIDAFKSLIQQGASGRIAADRADAEIRADSQGAQPRAVKVVKDFFARFTAAGRHEQDAQNANVRERLRSAITQAYGGRVPAETLDRLRDIPAKPLSVSDVRRIILTAEAAQASAVTVTLRGTGGQVALPPSTFSQATLSGVPNLAEVVQAKIDHGRELVNAVVDGRRGPDRPPSAEDVADIAWFLHVSAESKAQAQFKSGALTTVDGGARLRQFLDSSPESYQRSSSHLEGFKDSAGGQHRGIDLPQGAGAATMLPHGRTTLLYASMIPNARAPLPDTMLFLKLESHGCRLAGPSRRDAGHEDRGIRFAHDVKAFIGHSLSFLSGMSERASGNHGAETRKERIPGDVKSAFKQMVADAPSGLRETLMRNDPLGTAGGIRVMLANIAEARRMQATNAEEGGLFEIDLNDDGDRLGTPVHRDDFHDGTNLAGVTAFETEIARRYGVGDQANYRVGNEVILMPGDRL